MYDALGRSAPTVRRGEPDYQHGVLEGGLRSGAGFDESVCVRLRRRFLMAATGCRLSDPHGARGRRQRRLGFVPTTAQAGVVIRSRSGPALRQASAATPCRLAQDPVPSPTASFCWAFRWHASSLLTLPSSSCRRFATAEPARCSRWPITCCRAPGSCVNSSLDDSAVGGAAEVPRLPAASAPG